jgi:hypothetical protein
MKKFETQSGLLGFASKIILLVLGILLIYQGIGTLLSILTFEQIYLKGLTVRYKIIGSDLKNEIEGALKFGKSLEQFVGMDRIVAPLFEHHDDLENIFLLGRTGNNLFVSGRAEFVVAQGGADVEREEHRILASSNLSIPVPALTENFDWKNVNGTIIPQGETIYLLFPLKPRFGNEAGILGLAFNQKLFKKKRTQIIVSGGKLLALTLILTLFAIAGCLYFYIFRPVQRQIDTSCKLMESGRTNLPGPGEETVEEIDTLQAQMNSLTGCVNGAMADVSACLSDIQESSDVRPEEMKIIQQMQQLLDNNGKENRLQS